MVNFMLCIFYHNEKGKDKNNEAHKCKDSLRLSKALVEFKYLID